MTPGTYARIWLLVPVLLTTGCATSVQQAEEERGSLPAHSIDAGGKVFAFGGETASEVEEERGSMPAHSNDAGGKVFAYGGATVSESDRHRAPNPGGILAKECLQASFKNLTAGRRKNIGPVLAVAVAAVCLPVAVVVGIAHDGRPPPSASVGNSYDKPELRKLTDYGNSVSPTTFANNCPSGRCDSVGDGHHKPERRKLTAQEASVFPVYYSYGGCQPIGRC